MLISEICKAIYFGQSKRERYQIRLEFNCCKPLKVYPIIRNLYMLASKLNKNQSFSHSFFFIISFIRLWLFNHVDVSGDFQEFCWTFTSSFYCCLSTKFQLFTRHFIRTIFQHHTNGIESDMYK